MECNKQAKLSYSRPPAEEFELLDTPRAPAPRRVFIGEGEEEEERSSALLFRKGAATLEGSSASFKKRVGLNGGSTNQDDE